jgi:hypothetical protein
VEESARVVRPGGTIILMFPNAYANGSLFWEMDYTHGYFTTPRRVRQMCENVGLDVVAIHRGLHWFWVKPTPLHAIARFAANAVMTVVNWAPVTDLLGFLGLGGLVYRVRKTLFETAIVVARPPGRPAGRARADAAARAASGTAAAER